MPTQSKLYDGLKQRQWRFYCWLLVVSCCWQACRPLPQRSLGSREQLVQPLDFEYLTLSTTISYYQAGQPQRRAYVKIRLQKDQCIWFTVLGPWGLEVLRGMITPMGITLLNHVQKTYQVYDYVALQSLCPGPWDYALVQALLLGELARAYTPQEVVQQQARSAVIQQQKGAWMLEHLVNLDKGKLEKLVARSPQGTFTATYHQFKTYPKGVLGKQATFSWYGNIASDTPDMTVMLTGLKPKWSLEPLKFSFVIPPNYEKR